jgi:LPXTG-motif cell wall-anchored protein
VDSAPPPPCTTEADAPGSTSSSCSFTSTAGDKVTVSVESTPADVVITDPAQDIDPCVIDPETPPFCLFDNETFEATGLPPEVTDDSSTVVTSTTVDIPVLANDDLHGAPITGLTISNGPAHGTAEVVPPVTPPAPPTTTPPPVVVFNAAQPAARAAAAPAAAGPSTPVIRYTPTAGYVGPDSLQYTLSTGNGSRTGTVALSVVAPPVAKADSASTTAGQAVTVDVTANDVANGGTLAVSSVADPAHGTATIHGNEVVYTPAAGFAGTERFDYTVETAYGTDTATIAVTVTAPATTPPSTPPPTTPTTPAAAPDSNLSNTGADSAGLLGLAGGLVLAGGAATVVGRRRPRRGH